MNVNMRLDRSAALPSLSLHPFKRESRPLHLNRKSTARQAAEITAVILAWELAETGLIIAAASVAA
jgi:hypothetical protein